MQKFYFYCMFAFIVCFVVYLLFDGIASGRDQFNEYVKSAFCGRAMSINETGRGSCDILVSSGQDSIHKFHLHVAWDVEHSGMKVGDSICKNANSRKFTFYKVDSTGQSTPIEIHAND
jgi:hypothetical protein